MGMPRIYLRRSQAFAEQFWTRVEKTEGCWVWKASTGSSGYGQFTLNGRRVNAHRVAWILANGPIPNGDFVCHHCDNRRCVNPKHLFLGDARANIRDMWSKGRGRRAVTHCRRGHPLSGTNIYVGVKNGKTRRYCLACHRLYIAAHRDELVTYQREYMRAYRQRKRLTPPRLLASHP